MKTFGMVMVGLTVLGIILLALALFVGTFSGDEQARAELQRERAERNLQPIGAVRMDGEAMPVALARAEEPADNGDDVVRTGQDVYESVCMACHSQGVMDSPRTGDEGVWQALMDEKGFQELVENSINGIRGMPPRGGNPRLSDEEVENAVRHMLEEAGLSVDD
ncbi:MAG: cytochrome c5 family protein [Ectothiorhodospiraceae bacterium]|nr:cytochrome c5 family protein [Ectothiorhodospiraceae bacterium]